MAYIKMNTTAIPIFESNNPLTTIESKQVSRLINENKTIELILFS